MIERSIKRISMRALVVDDELTSPTAEGRAARALEHELQSRAIEVVGAASAEDGMSVVVSDSAIHAILVDWSAALLLSGSSVGARTRPFHPPYPEMRKVMRDVTAGLLAMCLRAR